MAKAKQPTTTIPSTPKQYNHRTPEGRDGYTADVLEAIKSFGIDGAFGEEVIKKAGGSQTQFRAAVKRLGDKVVKSGATSYTRYAAA